MQQQHQGKTSSFSTRTCHNRKSKHGSHDDRNRKCRTFVHARGRTTHPLTFCACSVDAASGNARGRRWFVSLFVCIIAATACAPEQKPALPRPVQAQGLILLAHPDVEILRRQCEASAAAFKTQHPHSVQLILRDSAMACIRVFGAQEQFTQLMNRLRHPVSGWKPHNTFSGWWQQQYLFRPANQQGILFCTDANDSCLRWNLYNGSRTPALGACTAFIPAPLNPDTLQFMESISFE